MASSVQIIDDDEEDFDWEAAVREIDVACQSTASKTLETPLPPPLVGASKLLKNHQLNNKLQNNSRQSTLDKFISNGNSKPCSEDEIEILDEDEQIRVQENACVVDIDPEAAKTWIYPDNVPRREYQLAIVKTALFSNTLVALPTGLGKTLIAAVVMHNYFRWFPEGKIVFAAPSRPLVMQQIEACHNIVGIPQEWTIDMTGLISPPKRASLWKSKRVFFVTPQVLEKDIQSGTCLVKYLVCLVIDEAHRAMGNYSYCVAVRELMAVPVELRIVALTATPGSKKETIQQVIDNLQITTLEYRDESDADVCPYVHNRKIELIEVPLGKDANEIHNLLLEVMRPMAAKLCAMGVLPGRDFQTLSPCDLLNSRDKFRQAPPPELSHVKYSEVESYFGVLITLYHIRKLLTSHGIRPAYEMLEEKLKQGYFARLMTRNEAIERAKLLMQKSLSHGAPSPKLSKMIEILVDHFTTKDPANSRVIIFSNFRGSVRDILDSLAHVGHLVKATQFIGQSSGKTLKGQSQKVQQAVLEKFRLGGYNVIVATSIGEEGLDIMEVDLVICFDANVSPLRMIQRMGRTGRKHDGRVVVLACDGTELKGYKRKQATGKTVSKYMRYGGMNSFNFHCSPRMVPHLLKPELQFVELSIEKFIRHAKKVKVDSPQQPKFKERLTDAEAEVLGKYFLPNEAMRPSLVAFPYFQTCPSRVHRVTHSSQTGWLIDAMQLLRGLSPNTDGNFGLDLSRSTRCLSTGSVEKLTGNRIDVLDPAITFAAQKITFNSEVSPHVSSVAKEQHMPDCPDIVLESLVPLPVISPSCMMPDSSIQDVCEVYSGGGSLLPADWKMFDVDVGDKKLVSTPPFDENCPNESIDCETEDVVEPNSQLTPAVDCDLDNTNSDFSPRLTSYFNSGVVPESPLSNAGEDITLFKKGGNDEDWQNGEEKDENLVPEPISTPKPCGNMLTVATLASKEVTVTSSLQTTEIKTPVGIGMSSGLPDGLSKMGETSQPSSSPEFRTPLRNLTNSSCDEDWRMSSVKKSGSSERLKRLKRLRRIGDPMNEKRQDTVKVSSCSSIDVAVEITYVRHKAIKRGKVRKPFEDARDFIDEEAEVSLEDVAPDSEDEVIYEDSDAYEESFIDDQPDPVVGSGQTEDSKMDMMAIYRRSLLTQSPYQKQRKHSGVVTPDSLPSVATIREDRESFGKICTQESPQVCLESFNISRFSTRKSVGSCLDSVAYEAVPSSSNKPSNAPINKATAESLKRKWISSRAFTVPAKNLEKDFFSDSALPSKEAPLSCQGNGVDADCASFLDDQFYEGLDLDELEAQATKLLSQRTGSSVQGRKISEPSPQDTTLISSPSFDLGIL